MNISLYGGYQAVSKELQFGEGNSEFKQKVLTIADEVFKILRELSLENKKEIRSEQIAERMLTMDSLQGLLSDIQTITEEGKVDGAYLKELSSTLLNKYSELIPVNATKKLGDLKQELHKKNLDDDIREWIDSPLAVIKNYIDMISVRNNDLEAYINKTAENMASTEDDMVKELSSQKQKFNDHVEFENSLSSEMSEIMQSLHESSDLDDIKSTVLVKIEELSRRIELKRQQDMEHIQGIEETLQDISRRMSDIKHEAEIMSEQSRREKYDSSHDALTGVYNKDTYEKKMKEILADVSRYGTKASLLVCDVDHFMKINSQWGHKLGDFTLIKLAVLIQEWMRVNDFVARYDEDLFVIILPHTDLEGALRAGERLRLHIDKANFRYKGDTVPLTISIGVSDFRKDDDIQLVFKRANHAVQLAKEAGRNTVKAEDVNAEIEAED